jgi:outer membrane protein TolC
MNAAALRLAGGLLLILGIDSLFAGETEFATDRNRPQVIHTVRKAEEKELPAKPELPLPKRSEPTYEPKVAKGYASSQEFAIDLPTTLRLVNQNSPLIGIARARLEQAFARQEQANLLKLPNVVVGSNYYRMDGNTQNQRGDIFSIARSNLNGSFGPSLKIDIADAIFEPLVAERITASVGAENRAVNNTVQLEAASAYLDLLQAVGALTVNADTIRRAERMMKYARSADEAGFSKTKADLVRAETEVNLRRSERAELEGRLGVASARLARVLRLNPGVDLKPIDPSVVPVSLIPFTLSIEELVTTAIQNRPELEANRESLLAARERVRQARYSPFIPKVTLDYQYGVYGGGMNSYLGDFRDRGVGGAQILWEVRNLGLGNAAQVREREAIATQSQFQLLDQESRVTSEVTASAKQSLARYESMQLAQNAVTKAEESYRRLQESSLNLVGSNRYDAIESLPAIQSLNQAQLRYLEAVIEFNRSQLQLYTALGQPPETAIEIKK